MHRAKSLALPGYLVAALLLFIPLLDTTLSIFPPRLGEVAWRFGAAGLFSRALMTPLLGLLLAFALAVLCEQRRVLRGLSLLSGVVVAFVIAGVSLFILDALQMRSQVRPEAKLGFDVATAVALGKYAFGMVTMLTFAICGWGGSRGERSVSQHARNAPSAGELIVRSKAPA